MTNTYTTPLNTKQVVRNVMFHFLFCRPYSIITNKDNLNKKTSRVKQVLQKNVYQESIISKFVSENY